MANMTAVQAVRRTRELLQVFGDAEAFRDGFSTDTDTTNPTPILAGINEFLLLLQPTGVRTEDTTINTVIGTATYNLAQTVGEIFSVHYGNVPLRPTTSRALQERDPLWRGAANGVPEEYIREGRAIRLHSKPSAVTTLTINSTLPITLLVNASDEIGFMTEAHQRFVPYGAAVILANVDAENKTHLLRKAEYRQYALSCIVDMCRIYRQEDFGGTMSLDRFTLPPQFEMNTPGQFSPSLDIYAPFGTAPTAQ